MAKKEWLVGLGERNVNPMDTDELLRSKVSERRRKEIERQDELDEATHKAKMAEQQKKTKSAEAEGEKIERKVETPEPPIKMEGKINLGEIDLQKEREEARREAKEAQQTMAQETENIKRERDTYREALHNEQIESVRTALKMQIEEQNKRFNELIKANASRGSILKQLEEMKATAKQLGLVEPQATGDIMAQIELKKLDFTLEDRKFEHEIALNRLVGEQEARREELRDKREFQKAQLAQDAQRNDMVAKAPQMIGGVIAQAMRDRDEGRRVTEEAPAGSKAPRRKQAHHIDAGWGESGEVECPGCNQPITIGPTAEVAVCATCDERFPIRRIGERPSARGAPSNSQTSRQTTSQTSGP